MCAWVTGAMVTAVLGQRPRAVGREGCWSCRPNQHPAQKIPPFPFGLQVLASDRKLLFPIFFLEESPLVLFKHVQNLLFAHSGHKLAPCCLQRCVLLDTADISSDFSSSSATRFLPRPFVDPDFSAFVPLHTLLAVVLLIGLGDVARLPGVGWNAIPL